MKVLLTGASGFVGQAVYPALLARGHEVVCPLRQDTYAKDPGRWKDAQPLLMEGLSPETDFQAGLGGTDAVIHLAGMAHIRTRHRLDLLDRFTAVNCDATLSLAEQAARAGVKRFVFLSSIGVNGSVSPEGRPFRETDPPNPDTAYGMSKLAAEEGLRKLSEKTDMEIVVLRPPLVFGPGAKANFQRLMTLVCSGIPLPFYGVNNRKNFIGLDSLADILILCLDHAAAAGQTFVVCDPVPVSTPELIRKIAGAMGRKARLIPFPSGLAGFLLARTGRKRIYDQLWGDLAIDAGKAEGILGWLPAKSLDEEIAEAVRLR